MVLFPYRRSICYTTLHGTKCPKVDTKDAIKMSKIKVSNELKIAVLEKKVAQLEKVIEDFMDKWGPDVQERRDRRDEVWDEMVRVVSIQKKHKDKK